jgi:hypothetical protein
MKYNICKEKFDPVDKISRHAMESEYISDNLDPDFAVTPEFLDSVQNEPIRMFYHSQFINYIKTSGIIPGKVLDVGDRNPLTRRLEHEFDIHIDSTLGDLDREFYCAKCQYDTIIFNHIIEHLFNPLFCLDNIRKRMHDESILIIGTPIKPGFITTRSGHFHEMDEYRFKKLIARAKLKIVHWRPFLSMFYRRHSLITCTKKLN